MSWRAGAAGLYGRAPDRRGSGAIDEFAAGFEDLADLRTGNAKRHELLEILLIALGTLLSGETGARSYYGVPIVQATWHIHVWGSLHGLRMSLVADDPEQVVVVPGGPLAPAAE